MEQHPLQSLINLIEFDRGIIKKEREVEDVQRTAIRIEEQKKKLTKDHEVAAQKVHDAKKIVHEHETKMKELDAAEKEKKKQLDETDSQKIHDALKKEINFLKKAQYDHEKQLVQCWKELEAAQKTFDQDVVMYEKHKTELTTQLTEKKNAVEQLKKDLEQLYQERTIKEKIVPEEWISKYNLMRTQTDNPIVRVEYESCGGCFSQLPPQALLDLKRKKLLQCTSCYRFIYLPEEIEEEPLMKKKEDIEEERE